jgi:hypothetical protein
MPAPRPKPDNRQLWEWESKYIEAKRYIRKEALVVGLYLVVFGLLTAACFAWTKDFSVQAGTPAQPLFFLRRRDVLIWLVGSVGGTIFAIKWLVHSVASGLWHLDRFLWRIFVPLTGGIYALVVLALMEGGFMGTKTPDVSSTDLSRELVIAFLAGYFADGVSGLLTNIANAIFGKVDKKT